MSDEDAGPRAATYPTSIICKLLDLTPQRVSQLTQAGVFQKAERNRYHLVPTVRAYVRYLRDRSVGRDSGEIEEDYRKGRGRLITVQADIATLELEEKRRQLAPVSEMARVVANDYTNVRAKLLSVPKKVAGMVAIEATEKACEALMMRGIVEALNELVADAAAILDADSGAEGADGSAEAAADPDGERVGGQLSQAFL